MNVSIAMICVIGLVLILLHHVQCQGKVLLCPLIISNEKIFTGDVCQSVHCGSGICITTQNPSLPYFCRCPSGSNTILPCPMESQLIFSLMIISFHSH